MSSRTDFDRTTDEGIGAPNGTGVTVSEKRGIVHETIINLAALRIAVADSGGANGGFGGAKIYDMPAGNIVLLGAITNLTNIARVSTGIGATATVKHSVGTAVEGTNDTLDAAQASIVPSTNAVLAAGVGAAGGESTAVLVTNGTSTAMDIYLNIGVADADISASDNVDVSGTVILFWINAGDN